MIGKPPVDGEVGSQMAVATKFPEIKRNNSDLFEGDI